MVVDRDDPSPTCTHRTGIRIGRHDHAIGSHRPRLGRHAEPPVELVDVDDRALFENETTEVKDQTGEAPHELGRIDEPTVIL